MCIRDSMKAPEEGTFGYAFLQAIDTKSVVYLIATS